MVMVDGLSYSQQCLKQTVHAGRPEKILAAHDMCHPLIIIIDHTDK